jgi:hypothetical protein
MEIGVCWKPDHEPHRATVAVWDYDLVWLINPDRRPTEQELSECPKVFTCYACSEKHPVSQLGGRYCEQWFCSLCIPYVDEFTAGCMVRWERGRKKKHFGRPKPERPPLTEAERLGNIVAAVIWAKTHGFTLP